MTLKRWVIPTGIAVAAALTIGLALTLASSGGDGGDEDSAADSEGDALGVCVEGVPDCVDTVVNTGEPVSDDPAGDEPVSSDPVTIIDDQDPNECNLVHNIDACERQATELAVVDLAKRLQVDDETITVVSDEFVQWPNACLGIEKPDVACAEVITPGFRILLEANGGSYEYHSDAGTRAVLVE